MQSIQKRIQLKSTSVSIFIRGFHKKNVVDFQNV